MNELEIYWEITSQLAMIAELTITAYLFYCFVKPYLKEKKYAWAVGLAYYIVVVGLFLIPIEMESIAVYVLGSSLAFVVMYQIDRKNLWQKAFLSLTMFLLRWLSRDLVFILWEYMSRFFITPSFFAEHPILQFCNYVLLQILYVLGKFFVIKLFIGTINRAYINKEEEMSKKEFGLMVMTPLTVLAGYISFIFFENFYLADMGQYIDMNHSASHWITMIYQMVSYAAILATVVIYQNIKGSYRREKENALLLGQIKEMENHINEVEELYSDIRGLKHDMGNHITMIEGLYARQEQQEAKDYIRRLKEQFAETAGGIKSGNPVTDVILTEKEKTARQRGIQFSCDFHYPEGTALNVFDVSVILSNALENAIEAAERCEDPYISVISYRKKNACIIEITNKIAAAVSIDPDSGLPPTTKVKKEGHGLGLHNIRKMVQKYQGDIDIEQSDDRFILSVMLITNSVAPSNVI